MIWLDTKRKKKKREGGACRRGRQKNPQEKSYLHKMHRKEINEFLAKRCNQPSIVVQSLYRSQWFNRLKKVEQRLQEQLIYNLINLGFIVHQEVAIPHWVWPIRLDVYAQRNNVLFGFEVKRTLDTRSLGQVSWYSNYLRKVIPEMEIFLAFSCHEFPKFIYPDVTEYVNKLREEFGLGICGIRDPLGDFPNSAKLYSEKFDWFDICTDCSL